MNPETLLKLVFAQAWQIAVLAIVVAITVRVVAQHRPHVALARLLIVVIKCVTPPMWAYSFGVFSQLQAILVHDEPPPPRELPSIETPVLVAEPDVELPAMPLTVPFDLPMSPVERTGRILSASSETTVSVLTGEPPETGIASRWTIALFQALAIGVVLNVLLLTTKFVRCLRRIRLNRVTQFDAEITGHVTSLAAKLNLKRVPRVIVSDVLFGPAVLGIFRHVIVLPKCLVYPDQASGATSVRHHDEHATLAQEVPGRSRTHVGRLAEGFAPDSHLAPILAHELLHIRRGDLWTGTLQAAVQCLRWFHPAVWIVNRLLSREAERCCDEQVIAELGFSPAEYARSLLAVIECKQRLRPVPVFPGMKPVEITSQRMERIMSLKNGSRKRMPLWSLVAVLLFAAVVLPGAVVGQSQEIAPLAEGDSPTLSVTEPGESTGSFAGTALNARIGRAVEYNVSDLLDGLVAERAITRDAARQFLIDGLTITHDDGKEEALLVLLQAKQAEAAADDPQAEAKAFAFPAEAKQHGVSATRDGGVVGEFNVADSVSVVGAVRNPGDFKIPDTAAFRMLDAISAAGGLEGDIDDRIVLKRPLPSGEAAVIALSLQRAHHNENGNVPLRPGDRLVVSEQRVPEAAFSRATKRGLQTLPQRASISVDNVSFASVVDLLGTQCDVKIEIDEPVKKSWPAPVRLHEEQMSLQSLLDQLCQPRGLKWQVREGDILISLRDPADAHFDRRAYNVSDLVPEYVPHEGAMTFLDPGRGRRSLRTNTKGNVATPRAAYEQSSEAGLPQAETHSDQAAVNTVHSQYDYSALTALIKSSVAPESWDEGGDIAASDGSMSLVIRQTPGVHNQISELLGRLRTPSETMRLACRVLQFETDEQVAWLDQHISLQTTPSGHRWALLSAQRSMVLDEAVDQGHAQSLFAYTIVMSDGQTSSVHAAPDKVLLPVLQITPTLFPKGDLFRIDYGTDRDLARFVEDSEMQAQLRSSAIVGSGQTLLLDMDDPRLRSNAVPEIIGVKELDAEPAEKLAGRVVVAITPRREFPTD